MKLGTILLLAALALSGCSTSSTELKPLSSMPLTISEEGTLANEILIRDATAAIYKTMGGSKPLIKFVAQKPVGRPGSKAWREIWIYDPKGRQQQFIITFKEDGAGSANFEIVRR